MFAHLVEWVRRHPRPIDFLWTLPLYVLSVLTLPGFTEPGHGRVPVPAPLFVCFIPALLLPLIVRRRWPRAVFATVASASFLQWLVHIDPAPMNVAVLVALYTVAQRCAFSWSVAACAVGVLGGVLSVWRNSQVGPAQWRTLFPFSVVVGAAWLWGLYVNTRRKYMQSLVERAERLERERDAEVQVATAGERARIAREMHDVIAHSVSVMVVQADGATYMVEREPDRARRAMVTIGDTGRQALTEMRRMLGVLRDDEDAGPYQPQPGVEQLGELVERIRSAGLPVELAVHGVPAELPAGLQLAVYRIVQESLTNIRKHAGPRATARVRLHYGDRAIEVRVCDDGRGAVADDGRGHGLVGMRERVAVYGGQVHAGPRPGGGFEVVARLPIREEAAR